MTTEIHELMGGKLKVYKRPDSTIWQCSACIDSRNWRKSTNEEFFPLAKEFAENWYLELRGKRSVGSLHSGRKFKEAAKKYMDELPVLIQGQRSDRHVTDKQNKLDYAILPFLGDRYLSEFPKAVHDYRLHRATHCRTGKAAARSTVHHEIVIIRQVLKTALRERWIDHVPDLSAPYKTSGKVVRRAWFSPEEYKRLYEATRERAANPLNERWRVACQNMHDFVLFMANTGLRPDEANNLEMRDVSIVDDEATGERILEIEVRGKRGFGYCKSMPGAVVPFERLVTRNELKPLSKVFESDQRELFNTILGELDLKTDRDGQRRTTYSLRHTYICFRLIEGADIYQIAKNCRTSVEMIQKFYAAHIKNMIDTAAINVVRKKKKAGKKKIERQQVEKQ